MPKKYAVSPSYTGTGWYDALTKTWFYPNKEYEFPPEMDLANVRRWVRLCYLFEIHEPEPEKPPLEPGFQTDMTPAQILGASERLQEELYIPRTEEAPVVEDIPPTCPNCGRTFKNQAGLKGHLRSCSPDKAKE